jgi:hypothetical protein
MIFHNVLNGDDSLKQPKRKIETIIMIVTWTLLIGGIMMMGFGLFNGIIWLFITGMIVEIISWLLAAAFID